MKLLIVDDEPIVRIGVKSLLQERQDRFELIAEAGNGEAALKLMSELEPDVVLADIRMPGMNGLEFISEARRISPCSKFIVLSCLNEFEYARAAMKLGVKDYIIKSTIDTSELMETIERLFREIDQEKAQVVQLAGDRKPGHFGGRISGNDLLLKLLDGTADNDDMEESLKALGLEDGCKAFMYVAFVGLDHRSELQARLLPREYNLLKVSAANLCREILGRYCRCHVLDKNTEEIAVILLPPGTEPEEQGKRIIGVFQDFVQYSSEYMEIACSVGISRPAANSDVLPTACKEAKEALEQRFFKGGNSVILFSKPEQMGVLDEQIKPISSSIVKLVISERMDEFGKFTESLVRSVVNRETLLAKEVKAFFCGLAFQIINGIRQHNEGMALPTFESLSYVNDFMESETIFELADRFNSLIWLLLKAIKDREEKSHNALYNRVREYINTNLSKDLSLNVVAENVKVTPQYISKIFKAAAGIGFNEFVLGEKMKIAKAMLLDNQKLWVIAQKTGYADIASFSRAFKRVEGISPRLYRSRML